MIEGRKTASFEIGGTLKGEKAFGKVAGVVVMIGVIFVGE